MIRTSCHALLALILFALSLNCVAQTASTPPQTQQATSTQPKSPTEDVAVLKAQLATMQAFTDDILETVYWSLGTLVVVAGLLAGFSWYSSNKIHARDIAGIRNELLGEIRVQAVETKRDLDERFNKKTEDLSAEISSNATEYVDAEAAKLTKRISSVQASLNELSKKYRYYTLKADIRHADENDYLSSGIRSAMALIELAIEDDQDHLIAETLKQVSGWLSKPTSQIWASDIPLLVKLLEKLPSSHSILAEEVREKLKNVKRW